MPLGFYFLCLNSLYLCDRRLQRYSSALKAVLGLSDVHSLFPELIAGPIVRYHQIADQIENRAESNELFLTGFYRLVIGLGKGVDCQKIGVMIAPYFAEDPLKLTAGQAWIGVIGFMMQIYFDFSGYSDMALGLSRMFGFRLPENFNNPFTAASITEFWQRWHISLSTWFQIYLFTPLALQWRSLRRLSVVLAIAVTFLASGLWHGACWNFVLWGALHGLLLILDRLFLFRVLQRLGRSPVLSSFGLR